MSCPFDVKPGDRHCEYCCNIFCGERDGSKYDAVASNTALPHVQYEKADETEKTDDHAKLEEAISYLTTRGWTCITPEGVDAVALYYAARSLVEAVEGYIMPKKGDKYVFRNEVLARCKELKDLLK